MKIDNNKQTVENERKRYRKRKAGSIILIK